MKKLLFVLLSLLVIANLAFAGEPMTSQGTKGLQFGFSGLNNLGLSSVWAPGGYNSIGMKYYISDDLALRPALMFGFGSTTTKAAATGNSDAKLSNMGIGLQLGLQSNAVKSGSFVGYMGGGASFALMTTTNEPSVSSSPAPGTTTKATTTSLNIGVGVLMGFEYFIYDHISLGGEYQLGVTLGSGSSEATITGATSTSKVDAPSTFGVGFQTVAFTLTAYW